MSGDTKRPQFAWPLPGGVPGLNENGALTEEAATAIANAAIEYAIAIRDSCEGFPDSAWNVALVALKGFGAYWESVRWAVWAGIPYDILRRDWVEEDIGLGPDAYSRSTEEAKRIWGRAFGSVFRRDEPA